MIRLLSAAFAAALLLTGASAASAQERAVNGGFETGAIAPFTVTPADPLDSGYSLSDSSAHTGTYGVSGYDNGVGGTDFAQTIATVPGTTYTISVFAKGTDVNNTVRLGIGGALGSATPLTNGYVQYSFSSVATSNSTVFHVYAATCGGCGNWEFDDVSVTSPADVATPVPTMTEWAMILFGTILAGGAAVYIQRRRQIV